MNNESITHMTLSSQGAARREQMRAELIGSMSAHHRRRRTWRSVGAVAVLIVAVGSSAEMARRWARTNGAHEAGMTAGKTERESEYRIHFDTSTPPALVKRVAAANTPGRVQMISNDQLLNELRQSGYHGGLIEVNGKISLTRSVGRDDSATPSS